MNDNITYGLFEELLDKTGKTAYAVSKATGISTAYLSLWKQNKTNPKQDKLQKIADFFNVPLTYFYPDAQTEESYFLDPETQGLAEELRNNHELKALFDVARDMPKEKLEAIYNLLKNM